MGRWGVGAFGAVGRLFVACCLLSLVLAIFGWWFDALGLVVWWFGGLVVWWFGGLLALLALVVACCLWLSLMDSCLLANLPGGWLSLPSLLSLVVWWFASWLLCLRAR